MFFTLGESKWNSLTGRMVRSWRLWIESFRPWIELDVMGIVMRFSNHRQGLENRSRFCVHHWPGSKMLSRRIFKQIFLILIASLILKPSLIQLITVAGLSRSRNPHLVFMIAFGHEEGINSGFFHFFSYT